ncbi:MAG: tRNA epoxyqueuosine(34) reductase QueG [Spirochaetales bacterium]|nr:tRNA epoxyqueuosine(34) reductase QueG [Spirochaetales bacterium]
MSSSFIDLEHLRKVAEAEGLTLLGITRPPEKDLKDTLENRYSQWISQGYAGDMDYLEKHMSLKYDPEKLLRGTKSLVLFGLSYFQAAPWSGGTAQTETTKGRIARYAWGRDYHNSFGSRLKKIARILWGKEGQGITWRSFVDSGPLDERYFGGASELGFPGRHTLLINHDLGSWFFLGEILTTLEYPEASIPTDPFAPRVVSAQGSCPSSCTRCIQVCPTKALVGSHLLDGNKCISYLTIEHKGSIPLELRPLMGDWIFGCDLCQEVCPLNIKAQISTWTDFVNVRAGSTQDLKTLLAMRTDAEFLTRFAGTPLMRPKREGIVRNACVAAGNCSNPELLPWLKRAYLEDSSPIVREHAEWAIKRL